MSPRVLAAACFVAATAAARPAKPPRAFSIVGATIHPVSGPDIVGGTIVVRDGRIASGLFADAAPPVCSPARRVGGLRRWLPEDPWNPAPPARARATARSEESR